MENNRVKRTKKYIKYFKPLNTGIIHPEKGTSELKSKALYIIGSIVMDFRSPMLIKDKIKLFYWYSKKHQ